MRDDSGVWHEPGCLAMIYPAVYGCFCEERMEERRRGESRLPPKHYMLDLRREVDDYPMRPIVRSTLI